MLIIINKIGTFGSFCEHLLILIYKNRHICTLIAYLLTYFWLLYTTYRFNVWAYKTKIFCKPILRSGSKVFVSQFYVASYENIA